MQDYLSILEHLLKRWNVGHLTGLSSEAAEAQDRVCNLPARYRWVHLQQCSVELRPCCCVSSTLGGLASRGLRKHGSLLTPTPCLPALVEIQRVLPVVHSNCSACPGLGCVSADSGSSLFRKLSDRAEARRAKAAVKHTPFSWIYDRPVDL